MTSDAKYAVGDAVEKHTGDYRIRGEVRGVFTMKNGAVRYAVEHAAQGGGSFLHVYAEGNLRPASHPQPLSPDSVRYRQLRAAYDAGFGASLPGWNGQEPVGVQETDDYAERRAMDLLALERRK